MTSASGRRGREGRGTSTSARRRRRVRASADRRAGGVGRGRGGFTLVELLIAGALLLALAGVAVPVYIASLRRETLRAAADDLGSFLTTARAIAQRDGMILEVVAVRGSEIVRLEAREEREEEEPETVGRFVARAGAGTAAAPRVEISLPAGVSLTERPPWELEAEAVVGGHGETAEEAEMVLGLLMPDGTLSGAREMRVHRGGDRAVVVRMSAWTGRVSLTWERAPPEEASRAGPGGGA